MDRTTRLARPNVTADHSGEWADLRASVSSEVARHRDFVEAARAAALRVGESRGTPDVRFVAMGRRRRCPQGVVTIAVTDAPTPDDHRRALASGAAALLDWNAGATEIRTAVDAARCGFSIMPSALSPALVARIEEPPEDLLLTGWQLALLGDIADGHTVEELAMSRDCSERNIRRRMRVIWEMLGADGRAQGIVQAARWGLVG